MVSCRALRRSGRNWRVRRRCAGGEGPGGGGHRLRPPAPTTDGRPLCKNDATAGTRQPAPRAVMSGGRHARSTQMLRSDPPCPSLPPRAEGAQRRPPPSGGEGRLWQLAVHQPQGTGPQRLPTTINVVSSFGTHSTSGGTRHGAPVGFLAGGRLYGFLMPRRKGRAASRGVARREPRRKKAARGGPAREQVATLYTKNSAPGSGPVSRHAPRAGTAAAAAPPHLRHLQTSPSVESETLRPPESLVEEPWHSPVQQSGRCYTVGLKSVVGGQAAPRWPHPSRTGAPAPTAAPTAAPAPSGDKLPRRAARPAIPKVSLNGSAFAEHHKGCRKDIKEILCTDQAGEGGEAKDQSGH
ncbi:uncharacterized protein LOC126282355 [Schistocerca gregaria]|uniref:uncharacterized protein LOC126282355 n=1 Tax=Schistocerca gregaria TaxID=7010 RepID=UPI00211E1EC7|nr:uncharacterized protein LOC126282355 [Schistocerca gregaria]